MPLPTDETLLKLSEDLLAEFGKIFGEYPGFRPAHSKGTMLKGTFTPTEAAKELSSAKHLNQATTPVVVRFSDGTGIPLIPDTDPNASPRGFAVRFQLAEHVHTDIVAHSTDAFPTRTGAEFLELLRALASSDPKNLAGTPLEAYLGTHPAALKFVQAPKPPASSFGREAYFGVTAMKFTNAAGVSKFGRYQIVPEAGVDYLDDETVKTKGPNYLFEEILTRVADGRIGFKVKVQVADESDVVDDATVNWPAEREVVEIGTIVLDAPVDHSEAEQKTIIFDPIPRLAGIEPSDDPLLELRAAIYLMSGRKRRAA